MKTHVITIAPKFPTTHLRAGEWTNFFGQIMSKTKLHTIRSNYELWAKRVSQVQEGSAILSLRQWSGMPYNSKQIELMQLTAADGIGVQKLTFNDYLYSFDIDGTQVYVRDLCANDGLSHSDFNSWFKKADQSEPMAVIQFTPFRYRSVEQQIALHSFLHSNKAI